MWILFLNWFIIITGVYKTKSKRRQRRRQKRIQSSTTTLNRPRRQWRRHSTHRTQQLTSSMICIINRSRSRSSSRRGRKSRQIQYLSYRFQIWIKRAFENILMSFCQDFNGSGVIGHLWVDEFVEAGFEIVGFAGFKVYHVDGKCVGGVDDFLWRGG